MIARISIALFFLSAVAACGQGSIRRVDNLATMLAVDPRAVSTSGKVSVQTAGRLNPGDGGGADYYWDSASNLATNTGTCFEVKAAGGRWLLENWTGNVRLFGAMADDSTDDTTAIQDAINYSSNRVIFPYGIYKITRPICITNEVIYSPETHFIHFDVRGEGPGKSTLKLYAPTNIIQISSQYAQDGVMANLNFTYDQNYATTNANCIAFMPSAVSTPNFYYNLTFENLTFSRGHYCFKQLQGASVWGCKFERFNVSSEMTGGAIDFHESAGYGNPNNIFGHFYILGDQMSGPIFYLSAQTVLTVTDMEINRITANCQVVNMSSCFNAVFDGFRVEVGVHSQANVGLFNYGDSYDVTFRNFQLVSINFSAAPAHTYVFWDFTQFAPQANSVIDGVVFLSCTANNGNFALINSPVGQVALNRRPFSDTPNITDQLIYPFNNTGRNVMAHFAQGPPTDGMTNTIGVGQRAQTNFVPLVTSSGKYYPDANYSWTQPETWGAKADNIGDDTAALQKALDNGGGLFLQPKIYRVTAALVVTNAGFPDVLIAGNGGRLNSAASDQPIFVVSNSTLRSVVIRDLTAGYLSDSSANTNTDVIVFQGDTGAGVHRPERVRVQSLRTVFANQAIDVRSRWSAQTLDIDGLTTDASMKECPIDLDNAFLGHDNLTIQNISGSGIGLPSTTPFIRMNGVKNALVRGVVVADIRGQLLASVIGEKLHVHGISVINGTFTQAGAGLFQLYDLQYPTIHDVKLTGVAFNVPASTAFIVNNFGTSAQLVVEDINLFNTTVTAGTVSVIQAATGKALLVGDTYTGTTAGISDFNPSGVATNFQRRVIFQANDVPVVGDVLKIGPNGVALWSPP